MSGTTNEYHVSKNFGQWKVRWAMRKNGVAKTLFKIHLCREHRYCKDQKPILSMFASAAVDVACEGSPDSANGQSQDAASSVLQTTFLCAAASRHTQH